ncbi:cell division protein FtsQ/DivIB [Candidatus Ruminimicrobium bovinum]|uniref:cell division protein FtsQ/DivIB n=1 Tax=Candidatus Ruminimicrobium bovinum TaxID=3242779 RepID=UPI0039B9A082
MKRSKRTVVRRTTFRKEKKKSKIKIFRIFLLLLIFIGIGFGFIKLKEFFYTYDGFNIETIEVVGCKNVTPTEIKELIPFKAGANIFEVSLCKLEKEIKELKPELKDITISRRWKKILVQLYEREPEVFIKQGNDTVGLDFDNIPFALRGNMFGMKIPMLEFSNEQERKELLNFVYNLKPFAKDFMSRITKIKYGEVEDIILEIDNKIKIFWGEQNKFDVADKASKMKIVLSDADKRFIDGIKYIDLNFLEKNKIIVKVDKIEKQVGGV